MVTHPVTPTEFPPCFLCLQKGHMFQSVFLHLALPLQRSFKAISSQLCSKSNSVQWWRWGNHKLVGRVSVKNKTETSRFPVSEPPIDWHWWHSIAQHAWSHAHAWGKPIDGKTNSNVSCRLCQMSTGGMERNWATACQSYFTSGVESCAVTLLAHTFGSSLTRAVALSLLTTLWLFVFHARPTRKFVIASKWPLARKMFVNVTQNFSGFAGVHKT